MMVKLPDTVIDQIVKHELESILESFEQDLYSCAAGDSRCIFSFNDKEEIKELKKYIKATKRLLEWVS